MITGIQETMMISDDQPTDLSVCGSTSSALLGRYPAITPPTTPELNCEKTENLETGLKGSAALPVENRTESNVNAAKIEELDSITMPKVNSHGKITTYKCKQCDYIATTKVDFWQHSKEKHYRPEKTFYCKFCPFATELKHHFEYHMNGHTGTKPYKCDKCEYSCVNKSMLNSHMKSHSQIYQYRCKDCLYVSKYCHSLKNHLRKYNHRPSAVLNLDGTENHHQIIDVYGTRRGPRQKQRSVNQNQQPNPLPEISSPNVPLFPLLNPFMFNEMLMQMAWQMQQRALLAQNFPSAPSSIHSNENTSSDDEEGNEAISEGENSCDPIVNNDDLKCNICEIAFSNKTMYDIHMTNHNPENPLKCRRCPTVCENGLEFFRHLHEKH